MHFHYNKEDDITTIKGELLLSSSKHPIRLTNYSPGSG